ncbi:Restriction endonuclease S subunit (HsdS) [Fructobacillus tropaeoli]|uniref:restriction endonuclease subunit S n=1 Tax=Fructobacillus tropaeoli TaxID=709323 RepID=UPI002D9BC29B|nr:Restriction endonuclease S subunit (HsdS) [Fructobacillus tropaeoli]
MKDLFDIKKTASFNKDRLTPVNKKEKYGYVTRTSINNGVLQYSGFVNEENINEANTFSLGLLQMNFFFQRDPWYAGQFVRKIIPKFPINNLLAEYFGTVLNKQSGKLLSVLVREVDETFQNTEIDIPVNIDGLLAFDYMEAYIKELEAERIKELEAYLVATGLNDYVLTGEEEKVLGHLKSGEIEWGVFKITDVFNITNTHNILKKDIVPDSGSTPYVTAGENNNGVSTCITYDLGKIERGNSILIAGKTMVVTYQPQDFFSNDSHNLSLNLRENNGYEKNTHLFLVSSLKAALSHKYEWGNSISSKKIKSDYISLPINNDKRPNYQIMSIYIKAIEKLVIKGVVEWKNKQIEATRDVANSD